MKKTIYAGTYTAKTSKGIYAFTFEDGIIKDPRLFTEVKNPKYIAKQEERLITLGDWDGVSGVGIVDLEGNITAMRAYEERTSCYVAAKGNDIYTANYHTGVLTHVNFDMREDHFSVSVSPKLIQDGAGCHQVLLWKDQILVPCLFLDRVVIFDSSLKMIGNIQFNAGTGPRHGVFTKDQEYLYLVSELSNELFVIHAGDWKIKYQIPVLESGETHVRDTAAIRLSEDEKYLYVSTRTKDVLSAIRLDDHKPTLIQNVDCGGKHPRDFILIDSYLLCANKNTNDVACFQVNEDGTIGKITSKVEVPEVVSLVY